MLSVGGTLFLGENPPHTSFLRSQDGALEVNNDREPQESERTESNASA